MTGHMNLQDFLSRFFGPLAVPAWNQLASIEQATRRQTYSFMDLESYQEIVRRRPEEAQAIYWREMMLRIHLAACSAVRRHGEWLRSLVIAVENECLFGAYASYRGFLESAADSLYSLGTIPTGIAPHLPLIINRIKRKPTDTITISKKLEDKLIHFSHGRKLERGESDDPVHAAKQIREYLDSLKQAGVKDVHALYSDLCAITHPSGESVAIWYEAEKVEHSVVWRRHTHSTRKRLAEFFEHWKIASEGIINLAFIPAFMSLRILHKFDFLQKIPNLKSFPLDAFPIWRQIERQISK